MQGFAATSLPCIDSLPCSIVSEFNLPAANGVSWRARANVRDCRSRPQEPRKPMTTFDKREEGFEKKFAHDAELQFKANARRNKLLGLWAAQKLGISGAEADAYAKAVVVANLDEAGDSGVLKKIRNDFDAKGVALTDQELRRT